ncbi:MAG: alpha-2-macroglobulin family protein [Bacteroidia bacterium]
MISKKLIIIFLIATATTAVSLNFIVKKKMTNKSTINLGPYEKYENLWQQVNDFENKGLPESALKVILEIYEKAKKEENAPQFVKAVIYKLKYNQTKQEFSQQKNIDELKLEIKNNKFPIKPILQSLLADSYWQYYQANRWQFHNRSQTAQFNNDDVATWDLKTIVNETIKLYKASLSESNLLKEVKLDLFDDIINKGTPDTRKWRPTLYDFLAHRSLDFFKNSEADVTKAAEQFAINENEYLKPYNDFLKFNVNAPKDSLELKYYAINLFKDLYNFNLKTSNLSAVLDLEFERLDFAYSYSKNELKDSLFLETLNYLQTEFKNSKRVAEVKHRIALYYYNKSSAYVPLQSDLYKDFKQKAHQICTEITKEYPNTRGAQLAFNTINTITSKALQLTSEQTNDVNLPNRVLVNYTNINKLYFKIVKTDYFAHSKLTAKTYGEKLFEKLHTLPEALKFTQSLPDDKDFNNHSVEIKIPVLEPGYYILLASTDEKFEYNNAINSYQTYIVTDIATTYNRKKEGGIEFFVLNRTSGEPLENASIQTYYSKYNNTTYTYEIKKGGLYKTDKNGKALINEIQSEYYYNYFVEIITEKEKYVSSSHLYNYRDGGNQKPHIKTHIFTDRSIYRPGQTIYFKALVMQSNGNNKYQLLTNHSTNLIFYDVNHQKVAEQRLTTNEYGTVAGSFIAPNGVLTGQMHITDGHGSIYFSVEEYKRPKFETYFDTLKGSYKLNDNVKVKGIAKAYAGNFIDGANVKYRVQRVVSYPYWCYWYRPYSNYGTSVEITNGTCETNAKGEYEIEFKALPDPTADNKNNPTYLYTIIADVTDINGETRSTKTFFRVANHALELSVNVPETINTNNLPKITISAHNLNGVEENAKGTFNVYSLKQNTKIFRKRLWAQPDKHLFTREEYYKLFPNDMYDDETNIYKWERLKLMFSKNFDTKTSKNNIYNEFENLPQGVYVIETNCKDKNNQDVKTINYVTIFNPTKNELPVAKPFWPLPIKTTCEPGDTAKIILASSYKNVHLLNRTESEVDDKFQIISTSLNFISTQINENNRGGIINHYVFVKHGRFYSYTSHITVPFSNKLLNIEYATFRDKLLPGQQEQWQIIIKNKNGEKVAAEMLAAMYDASLDAFKPHYWSFYPFVSYYARYNWISENERITNGYIHNEINSRYVNVDEIEYDALNSFGLYYYNRYGYYDKSYEYDSFAKGDYADDEGGLEKSKEEARPTTTKKLAAVAPAQESSTGMTMSRAGGKNSSAAENKDGEGDNSSLDGLAESNTTSGNLNDIVPRKNFNETAFFYPQLQTNEKGEIIIKFTIPESLTKWKFMTLAHTKDLSIGQSVKEVVTQKELMVQPNAPRFFREFDTLNFVSKIANLNKNLLNGIAELKFYDAITETDITSKIISKQITQSFTIEPQQSTSVRWSIIIPQEYQAIKYKIVAKAGNFSDGEEMVIPVLTNRMLVTESMPLPIRGNQTKDFTFTKFINQNNNSSTLKNHALTLEFTANPAWYAVQSLPYLMEYPYECSEQTFARYYANALASHIANSKPKIKQVFESWKTSSPEAFYSNLQKNEELKAVILQETPWVLESKNETENKKRVGLLFDLNKMSYELNGALTKLQKAQSGNGGWPWFKNCPEDWYITQYIATGFAHLQKLNATDAYKNYSIQQMVNNAVLFCDKKLKQDFDYIKKHNKNYLNENHLSYMHIQYLYMRSYFDVKQLPLSKSCNEAVEYFKKQAQKYWLQNSRYMQGMIALSLNRFGDKKTPTDIMKSLKENALNNEEMGMYWKDNYAGYYWYQAPIEMQALMIEAFDEVSNDLKAVDDLKTWLIKSKQTQNWGTTRATSEAIYAMLLRGSDWLATEPNVEINLGNVKINPKTDKDIKVEPGTGYFKKVFTGNEIQPSMGKVKVVKKDAGVSYGSLYWQYFEQLDKITPHETPLKLNKKLFVEKNTASGPVIEPITKNKLKVGDKVIVRIELRVDRDMEYVHLKDMRASGFEPLNVLSRYKYQDGLGYYEATKDASTNFFISYLPKGTFVFEYPLVVSHAGNFSNGISTIQCMYAPEFTSHSEGIRVKVE